MSTSGGTLAATNITKCYGADDILKGVSVVVAPRARIGVVGPNGAGKTTLLRVLAGLEAPDSGRVDRRPSTLTVEYLPQDATLPASDEPAWEVRKAAARVGLELAFDRSSGELSGGELARMKLAALIVDPPDVLLLDEPTNDLDFDGLTALERFVAETPSALVVVSHDRAFLENTVERIIEFEAETHTVREFAGSWAEYERLSVLARKREEAAHRRYVAERDRVTGLLDERRMQARAAGKLFSRRGTHALKSKVRAAQRRLERLEEVDKPWQPWRLRLDLSADWAGDLVARLTGAVVERGDFRLGPIDLELRRGDRLAVIGPNGSGKTSLLRALLGELPLAAGSREIGPGVSLGELEQRRAKFNGDEPLLDTFCDRSSLSAGKTRTLLAKFSLGADAVARPSASLSPGERTRAGLALLSAQGVTALMLDEPTNHLDLEAIEELEAALESYEGTIVLVTHDRRMLERFSPTQTLELFP